MGYLLDKGFACFVFNPLNTNLYRKALSLRKTKTDAALTSVGCFMPAKSLELKHTVSLIRVLSEEIEEIESEIKNLMDELHSPITSIPGISCCMAAMILSEIGDFSNFDSPDKLLAFAELSPSTYQSGKLDNAYSHMEKRGSRYLRYALYIAATYVCFWDKTFADYLHKKLAQGKHYYVAISHAIKKLVRVIYAFRLQGSRAFPLPPDYPILAFTEQPHRVLFLSCAL